MFVGVLGHVEEFHEILSIVHRTMAPMASDSSPTS
jgi:hypothetical protein